MKQKTLLKTMLLLCALIVGSSAWAADVTETLSISDYASTNSWANESQYTSATVGNVSFSANGSSNTGKYYTSDNSWRFYANESATLTISVPKSYSLVSVMPTFTVKDNGTLNYNNSSISSGSTINVSGESVVFTISQSSGNKGKVFFTVIKVVYTSGGGGDTPTTYTVTYNANGGTGTMTDNNSYKENEEVTLLANAFTAPTGKKWDSWSVEDALEKPISVTDGKFTMPANNVTVTAQWADIPTHTVTFSVNGETSTQDFDEGAAITFPSVPAAISGKSFMGWVTEAITGTTNTAPSFVTSATMGTSDITYYAVFADVTPGSQTAVTDGITLSTTGVSGSSYSAWSGMSVTNGSGAVYAGNSAAGNDAIQLRSKDNSGIVTTTSGGKATKVEVSWNTNTSDNRVLDIYGKSSAYSGASDLYGSNSYGTLLGRIYYYAAIGDDPSVYTTELTITGDYQYIGLRSSDGAMYLDEIDITWTTGTPDTYSNYCTSVVEYAANAITGINASYTVDLANNEDEVDLNSATATSGAAVQFEVLSSTIDVNNYELTNGVLTVTGNGVIEIRAFVNGDAQYESAEKTVTVTVVDDPVIGYAGETETTVYGTPYTVDESLIEGGAVSSILSGNDEIATVEGLVITPVAVGSVTITVNTAATDIWHAGSATFTLNITAPEGSTTAPISDVVVFNETFAGCTSSGGNDTDGWSGSIAGGTLTDGTSTDNSGWTFSAGNAANGCAKFGSSNNGGSAATPDLTLEDNVSYTLTFKAAAWNSDKEETTLGLSASNASFYVFDETENDYFYKDEVSVTLVKGAWTSYTLTVVADDASQNANITFLTTKGYKRFFLDDVKLTKNTPVTATVTLNKYGYATYCSVNPIDFSSTTGYTAWRVSEISGTTITFEKITETIKGGQGVLLYNKDADGMKSTDVTITFADGTKVFNQGEDDTNLLVGTLAPTYVAANEYYGLSGNTFVKVNSGNVPAGKALLPASVVPNASRLTFVFEDVQGIKTIEHSPLTVEDGVYNLNGQRVDSPKKGLYIVNGKKVMVK